MRTTTATTRTAATTPPATIPTSTPGTDLRALGGTDGSSCGPLASHEGSACTEIAGCGPVPVTATASGGCCGSRCGPVPADATSTSPGTATPTGGVPFPLAYHQGRDAPTGASPSGTTVTWGPVSSAARVVPGPSPGGGPGASWRGGESAIALPQVQIRTKGH
ncbi:hypothetical protein ACFQHO_07910 [Actinomadura yumaensis]|uniref:hypothetical protein n=1 Tax=Actinomadura TaxID=1988 RepID=UPI0013262D34|nr:hypothetical protein [Actinomadura sp. J1-007]MWK37421.1 hypothetical protein [Actinomadura sp. J1-007]